MNFISNFLLQWLDQLINDIKTILKNNRYNLLKTPKIIFCLTYHLLWSLLFYRAPIHWSTTPYNLSNKLNLDSNFDPKKINNYPVLMIINWSVEHINLAVHVIEQLILTPQRIINEIADDIISISIFLFWLNKKIFSASDQKASPKKDPKKHSSNSTASAIKKCDASDTKHNSASQKEYTIKPNTRQNPKMLDCSDELLCQGDRVFKFPIDCTNGVNTDDHCAIVRLMQLYTGHNVKPNKNVFRQNLSDKKPNP